MSNSLTNTLISIPIKGSDKQQCANTVDINQSSDSIKPVEIAEAILNRFPEIERRFTNILIKRGEFVLIPDDDFMKEEL